MRSVQQEKLSTEDPELARRFNRALEDTVGALDDAGIKYAFIGGIASGGMGRPRSTHDIDIFVTPEDAELALRALSKRGFKVEKTDPNWLYKGFKHGILVDVIFKSKGDIYFDNEMYQRMITAEFHGRRLRFISPEDLVIIKAVAHSEMTPGHWHDAMALLSYANIDWDYLVRRARRAPRRILSLMLYAQSNDIWIPNRVIDELYRGIFGGEAVHFQGHKPAEIRIAKIEAHPRHPDYCIAHLREALAEDPRTNELDIRIEHAGNKILLKGEVASQDRKDRIEKMARETCPGLVVDNQIDVSEYNEPGQAEEFR